MGPNSFPCSQHLLSQSADIHSVDIIFFCKGSEYLNTKNKGFQELMYQQGHSTIAYSPR